MQINLNEIEIPRQELQDVVDRSMASIRKMHRKKRIWKSASRFGAAAASIAVIAGIFAANPALAENLPLIGHIFERVQFQRRTAHRNNCIRIPGNHCHTLRNHVLRRVHECICDN